MAILLKVFISHQQRDTDAAKRVYDILNRHPQVLPYLDVLDSQLARSGDDLSEHIIARLQECSHLIAVVSEHTRLSWWVPFEIGIATDRRYPLATFAAGWCEVPEYLKKWPYLRSEADVQKYAEVAVSGTQSLTKRLQESAQVERETYTRRFHSSLKVALGQS